MWEKTVTYGIGIAQCEDGTVKCEGKKKGNHRMWQKTVTCDVGTAQCEDGTVKCEKQVREPSNVTKELSHVMLELHNMRIESLNVKFW